MLYIKIRPHIKILITEKIFSVATPSLNKIHRKMRKLNHSGGHSKILTDADKNIRRGKFPCVHPEKINVKLAMDNAENSESENQNPEDLQDYKFCRDFVV